MRGFLCQQFLILAAVLILSLEKCASTPAGQAGGTKEEPQKKPHRHQPWEEADDDARFAAAMLGTLHDTVRGVGNVFRVVGDTTGALTGGSIKAVGATVNGLSSALDAASRNLDFKPKGQEEESRSRPNQPNDPTISSVRHQESTSSYDDDDSPATAARDRRGDGAQRQGQAADPLDRISTVTRSSVAGSLRFVSAAMRGVGEAVFQAGAVAEGLAGGTGQVAEDLVRVVQGALDVARDDMENFGGAERQGQVAGSTRKNTAETSWASNLAGSATFSPESAKGVMDEHTGFFHAVVALVATTVDCARRLWHIFWAVACLMGAAGVREAVQLFRHRDGGAPPAAPRVAVLMVFAIGLGVRRRRRRQPAPPPLSSAPNPAASAQSETVSSHRRLRSMPANVASALTSGAIDLRLGQSPASAVLPTAAAAEAAGLSSPSRSLLSGSPAPASIAAPALGGAAVASPSSGQRVDDASGVNPSLPSPAQQLRESSLSLLRGSNGGRSEDGGSHSVREAGGTEGRVDAGDEEGAVASRRHGDAFSRWWARLKAERVRRWWSSYSYREKGNHGGRRRWLGLVVLWFVASVLEERERDRVAWLAWDEGFREGQASRAVDSSAESETVAWLNHLVGGLWGGQGKTEIFPSGGGGSLAADGLSSFISQQVAESVLEALEEFKPTSVVGVKLQDVDLGSVAPQVVGIKILDPTSSSSPGGTSDDRCHHPAKCVSLRVDLELATRGLRVGVAVKLSNLEKALLPSGKVRLLGVYFRGSVSVRIEVRDEFPFVGMSMVAFNGVPEVRVRMEQWGLDALTFGAVDEWVRMGLRQAMKPYVLPGYLEIDAREAICPECGTPTKTKPRSSDTGKRSLKTLPKLQTPSLPPSASPTRSARKDNPSLQIPDSAAGADSLVRRTPPAASAAASTVKAAASAVAKASYFPEPKKLVDNSDDRLGTSKSDRQPKGTNIKEGKGNSNKRWFSRGRVTTSELPLPVLSAAGAAGAVGMAGVAAGAGAWAAAAQTANVLELLEREDDRNGDKMAEEPAVETATVRDDSPDLGADSKKETGSRRIGRAATMSGVDEDGGGKAGPLRWLKDRLGDKSGGGGGKNADT